MSEQNVFLIFRIVGGGWCWYLAGMLLSVPAVCRAATMMKNYLAPNVNRLRLETPNGGDTGRAGSGVSSHSGAFDCAAVELGSNPDCGIDRPTSLSLSFLIYKVG